MGQHKENVKKVDSAMYVLENVVTPSKTIIVCSIYEADCATRKKKERKRSPNRRRRRRRTPLGDWGRL
jgi:hypothetical protein